MRAGETVRIGEQRPEQRNNAPEKRFLRHWAAIDPSFRSLSAVAHR